ncbi:MAG: mitochondrial fission ELM1 family protein [Alphaproteobacteria bacterium]|nr:mitochondrial fission ELM1 family protein [Alphaproteobacteria bacterium]
MKTHNLTCWVIYDAKKVGTGNQCLGLASALGFASPTIIEISAQWPWRYLSSKFWLYPLKAVKTQEGAALRPPWPDVIIAAGRASAAPAAEIRKRSRNKTFVIQLQNPYLRPELFNIVVAPAHDQLEGENVIVTTGALHPLKEDIISQAAIKFEKQFSSLKRPFVAVLIGGTNKRYKLTPTVITSLAEQLKVMLKTYKVGLAITPSRRTEPKNYKVLQEHFKDLPVYIWNGQSENPYLAMLGLAQTIIVTADSVSMISEACATGKPVYVFPLPGGSAMSRRFHTLFNILGYTRPFIGKLEHWSYQPLNDMLQVVKAIQKALRNHIKNS